LRHTENRIQAMHDQQTQELPADEFTQQRLALAMGFATWSAFVSALQRQMEIVHQHFQQVFVAPQTQASSAGESELTAIWLGRLEVDAASDVLRRHGFSTTHDVLERLQQLREGSTYRQLTPSGRERLDRLIPLLIGAASQVQAPHQALLRTLRIIEAIGRRAAYYALLIEHPMAMSQLVKLCAASVWITDYVAKHPILLDDLLDPRALYTPLTRDALAAELRTELQHIQDEDVEQQMEVLRHFAHSNILRVACSDVANAMPLMIVSDHLTEIAEVVLAQVLEHSWRYLTARHGVPHCTVEGERRPARFAVIAYGKLGGIELGYGSDLDLVFLHDSEGEDERTEGAKPIDNAVFFVRLAQRIIHVLNTQTVSGVLYEIDVRLRPSGAAGLLVSSLLRFADYQRKEAWTWEHQALVRARLVAGAAEIGAGFRAVRAEVLARARDADTLRQEVREMREKMRAELGNRDPNVFDLKHDEGGIADIEFMVQYGVLRWAHDYPQLLGYPDNIRLLEILAAEKLLAADAAQFLADAYRRLRGEVHRLTLQQLPARTDPAPFAEVRARVTDLWRAWFGA
jgi:glutamate-ammonia-ligase adenylyltransferase